MKLKFWEKLKPLKGGRILQVTIRKRDGLVFEGRVKSFSSINATGPFDVLPFHANFVCTLQEEIRLVEGNNRRRQIEVERGLLRAKGNRLEVFLGL